MAHTKKKKKKMSIGEKNKKNKKLVRIKNREFEILGENRFSARIFEAILARGAIIMDSLDKARIQSFEKGKSSRGGERPVYKHTILLGRDDEGHNLRASIAVFENSVVVQTLRET
jgi:hypothetical protein